MAAIPNWPIVEFGSRQRYVYAVQHLLNYHGASLTVDGAFGSGTRSALISFQNSHSLSADGVAGPATLQTLIRTIGPGSNNAIVSAAQTLMSKFEETSINGAFNAVFENTVKTFQRKMQISADGIIGPTTWQYLFGYTAYNRTVFVSNTTLTRNEMVVNARYVLKYLTECGWTKNAVCGMLGNMETESYINPGYWENGVVDYEESGVGLTQWTPPTKYTDWATDNGLPVFDMDSQLMRILYEVDLVGDEAQYFPVSPYKFSFREYTQSTKSAYELACAFLHNYERPGNPNQDETRGGQAEWWFNRL